MQAENRQKLIYTFVNVYFYKKSRINIILTNKKSDQ